MSSSPQGPFFIDTNIFLELLFQDARWEECRGFLKKVETRELNASTSDFVVYSAVLEIAAKSKRKSEVKVETFLESLASLAGLSLIRPTMKEMKDATEFMGNRKLDFDDSYVVSCMIANKMKSLVSFDRHFDKLNEVKRIEPIEILNVLESGLT